MRYLPLLLILAVGCTPWQVKPTMPDLENYCLPDSVDPEQFRQMPSGHGIRDVDYYDIRESNRLCREHLTTIATENYYHAEHANNKRFETGGKWGAIGVIVGFLLGVIALL